MSQDQPPPTTGGGGEWQRTPYMVPPPQSLPAAAGAAGVAAGAGSHIYYASEGGMNVDEAAAATAAAANNSTGGALRLRKGSTDSTRGAFYTGDNRPQHGVIHRNTSTGSSSNIQHQQQQHVQHHHQHHQLQQQIQQQHRSSRRSKRGVKKSLSSDLAVSSSEDTPPPPPPMDGYFATAAPQEQHSGGFLLQRNDENSVDPTGGGGGGGAMSSHLYYYPHLQQPQPLEPLETIRDSSISTVGGSLYFGGGGGSLTYGSIPENQAAAAAQNRLLTARNHNSNNNNNNNNNNNSNNNTSDRFSMISDDSLRFSFDTFGNGMRSAAVVQDAAAAMAQLQQQRFPTIHEPQSNNQDSIAFFSSMVQQAAGYGSYDESSAAAAASEPQEKKRTPAQTNATSRARAALRAAAAAHEEQQHGSLSSNASEDDEDEDGDDEEEDETNSGSEYEFEYSYRQQVLDRSIGGRIMHLLDPTEWLMSDVQWTPDGSTPYFESHKEWTTLSGMVRHCLFNPISPEFTSLQQFNWAVIVGIVMGIYTAIWKTIIEGGVDFLWQTVPEWLLKHGVFTDLNGRFPIYHYMWICPTIFSAILSYIFVILPNKIPGQNEWINSLHTRGVQDYRTFWPLFILSTLGMMSGLSLGPELPLVLTAGMFGSWLGLLCKQSMLQARVMNLTAAGAAIGGFFGFPMAGALFVLELPHRMGLQYFEALSPATISSIVAVISNRLVTGNDVTGYYKYPFLTESLPSSIFTHAMFYGVYGGAIGMAYAWGVLEFKHIVSGMFQAHHHHTHHHVEQQQDKLEVGNDEKTENEEMTPLNRISKVGNGKSQSKRAHRSNISMAERMKKISTCLRSYFCLVIPDPAYRAAARGAIAGLFCGVVGIFVPHTMFWGEAQLQNLIDKGRTPLPVFGQGAEPTADFLALGYCMIDPSDKAAIRAGFSVGCALAIAVTKTIVIGVSLGTGIIGGHFWGPLFVGCAASHFLSDVVQILNAWFGLGPALATYPCVVMLCTMGAAHVVTYRAHMGIMLILTLTISAFSPEDGNPNYSIAGDYSAIFPLLVISVFMSLMISRSTVFYSEQRSRGDITAVPEVLCEPGMEGRPLVDAYEASDESCSSSSGSSGGPDDSMQDLEVAHSDLHDDDRMTPSASLVAQENEQRHTVVPPNLAVTPESIEDAFLQATMASSSARQNLYNRPPIGEQKSPSPIATPKKFTGMSPPQPPPKTFSSVSPTAGPLPPMTGGARRRHRQHGRASTLGEGGNNPLSSERLDELLSMPLGVEPISTSSQFDQSSQPSETSPGTNSLALISPSIVASLPNRAHRRTMSAPTHPDKVARAQAPASPRRAEMDQMAAPAVVPTTRTAIFDQPPSRERSNSNSGRNTLIRVSSFGELGREQPSLMDQARFRAASNAGTSCHQRKPSLPSGRHSRKNSAAKVDTTAIDDGALSFDEIERTFNNVAHVAFSNAPSPHKSGGISRNKNSSGA